MNERIRELAVQAHTKDNTLHYYNPEFIEKLAELIVRECADISEVSFHNGSAGYLAILNYFGVEQ